jgi:RecA-family ATPase
MASTQKAAATKKNLTSLTLATPAPKKDEAQGPSLGPPPPETWHSLIQKDLPESITYLEPWLVGETISMLYSEPDLGKTALMLSLAYLLAYGDPDEDMLGHWELKRNCSVLYVDARLTETNLQQRVLSLGEIPKDSPHHVYYLNRYIERKKDRGLNLWRPAPKDYIERIIKGNNDIRVVVFDDLIELWPASTNVLNDWNKIDYFVRGLRDKYGTAVVILHHPVKNGKSYAGSYAVRATVDVMLKLVRPEGNQHHELPHFLVLFEKKQTVGLGMSTRPFLMEMSIEEEEIETDEESH